MKNLDEIKERKVSVEHGLKAATLFFWNFWQGIEYGWNPHQYYGWDLNQTPEKYQAHLWFFCFSCGSPKSTVPWMQAVAQVKKEGEIDPEKTLMTLQEVFESMVIFCRIQNSCYANYLLRVEGVLKKIAEDPSKYQEERVLLDSCISRAESMPFSFIWDGLQEGRVSQLEKGSSIQEEKNFTVPQGYFLASLTFKRFLKDFDEIKNGSVVLARFFSPPFSCFSSEWIQAVHEVTGLDIMRQKKALLSFNDILFVFFSFCKICLSTREGLFKKIEKFIKPYLESNDLRERVFGCGISENNVYTIYTNTLGQEALPVWSWCENIEGREEE